MRRQCRALFLSFFLHARRGIVGIFLKGLCLAVTITIEKSYEFAKLFTIIKRTDGQLCANIYR